jgi:cation-transporting P-type ATPase 13A2
VGDIGDLEFGVVEDDDDSADRDYDTTPDDYLLRRRSSTISRGSATAHLLRRDSTATTRSSHLTGRASQKLYMRNEDLTIAIAGFETNHLGYIIYGLLCCLTGGLGYLVLRWVPRWYVAVVGKPCSLRACQWVVIQNEWAEMVIMPVKSQFYGRPVSTVFGSMEKMQANDFDDEADPIIEELRTLDYRYVRLSFHPLKDKFVLSSGWKDPEWTDTHLVRSGLDSDEKAIREILFGGNLIDIEQKSVGQLLIDEVGAFPMRLGNGRGKETTNESDI